MSATTVAPPAPSPLDFVKSLSPETKGEVFYALLQELVAAHEGEGLIPIYAPGGEMFGHYVSPAAQKAQWEAALARMPESVRIKMTEPLPDGFDPDDCLSEDQMTALREEAGLLPQ